MPLQNPKGKFEQLITDGFCLAENVLDPDMLSRLQQTTNQLLDAQSDEKYDEQRSTGSMVDVGSHPIFAELVAYPPARTVLEALGFLRPKWMSGYVISKPPERAPALFWHQDGIGWSEAVNYTDTPVQFFLMYYLTDTRRENGCLRAISGSHLKEFRKGW